MTRRLVTWYAGSEVGELLDKLASFHDDFWLRALGVPMGREGHDAGHDGP